MIELYLITAAALVAAGVALGIVAAFSLGVRHEEKTSRRLKASRLRASSPGRLASTARAVSDLHATPSVAYWRSATWN